MISDERITEIESEAKHYRDQTKWGGKVAIDSRLLMELLDDRKEKAALILELESALGAWTEYFGAIKEGVYDSNRRSAPLRAIELTWSMVSRKLLKWDDK